MNGPARAVALLGGTILLAAAGLFVAGQRSGAGRNAVTIELERPAAQVFPWLTEEQKLKRWLEGLVASKPLSEGPLRVGFRSREIVEAGGERTEMEMEITAFESNRIIGAKMWSPLFQMDVRYDLSEVGSRTTLRYTSQAEYRAWYLQLIEPLITPAAQRKLDADFARLKQLVESPGQP